MSLHSGSNAVLPRKFLNHGSQSNAGNQEPI